MSAVRHVRLAGILEGVSYLVLLGIAMPLKYLAGYPLAVRIVGSAHGVLFVWFVIALLRAHYARRWSLLVSAQLFVASLVPFGFFLVEPKLRREIASAEEPRLGVERAP